MDVFLYLLREGRLVVDWVSLAMRQYTKLRVLWVIPIPSNSMGLRLVLVHGL